MTLTNWISTVDHEWHRIDTITGEYVAKVIVDEEGDAHITVQSEAGEVVTTLESMGAGSKDRQRTAINAKAIADVSLWDRADPDLAGQCRTFRDDDAHAKVFWGPHWTEIWGLK